MEISVIVTTYNRPQALDRVLESLAAQDTRPLEVIVADDGSGPPTAEVVARWRPRMGCPLIHVWQADEGFRAGRSRNGAVAASHGSYLVFLDGDCVAFADFVRRHAQLAQAGRFVAGSRVLAGRDLTARIESGAEQPRSWSTARWLRARLRGEVNRVLALLRLPGSAWRLLRARRWQGARSCNLAIWRDDFLAVNGFDEEFQGWGHEDAELVVRLMRHGILRKEGRFAVAVLHLWHREGDRHREALNRGRLQDVIEGRRPVRASAGLDGLTPIVLAGR